MRLGISRLQLPVAKRDRWMCVTRNDDSGLTSWHPEMTYVCSEFNSDGFAAFNEVEQLSLRMKH